MAKIMIAAVVVLSGTLSPAFACELLGVEGNLLGADRVIEYNDPDLPEVVFPQGLLVGPHATIRIVVDRRGYISFDRPVAWREGFPLSGRQERGLVIAPFWAPEAPDECARERGRVLWRATERGIIITWIDIPLGSCVPDPTPASFELELIASASSPAQLERITFRYVALPFTTRRTIDGAGALEPRAGYVLRQDDEAPIVYELLPDNDGLILRGRAKILLERGNDESSGGCVEGVWRIDIDAEGRVIHDADQDGLRDSDNCWDVPNPLQLDYDWDGDGDACDLDDDNDSHPDHVDNCPFLPNVDQRDSDRDGIGDACPDDGDLIPHWLDNCPLVFNPAQSDLDADGIGDGCDADPDGDGVATRRLFGGDVCPWVADPAQIDTDRDGMGDACDLRPRRKTAPFGVDSDADGDGIADPVDNCPHLPGVQMDHDGDGTGDGCDPDAEDDGDLDVLAGRCYRSPIGWLGRCPAPPIDRAVPPIAPRVRLVP